MKHCFLIVSVVAACWVLAPGCGNGGGGETGECGDGVRDDNEGCDGDDFGGDTCTSYGFDTGTLSCLDDCTADTSACSNEDLCPNGVRDPGEQCDGNDFGGDDCTNYGFDGGDLSCQADCTVDTSNCTGTTLCPNGERDPGEECDGDDFGGDDCTTYGYDGGDLSCRSDCTVDLSDCTSAALCPNGERDPGEECDGTDFGGDDCTSYGYDGGDLSCRSDCTVDTSGCTGTSLCQNGERDPGEECDGTDFGGDDCTSYGYDTGSLACHTDCTVDMDGCFDFPDECTRHEHCAGHPDGNLCIFFEGRCGECLSGDDCSGAESVCDLDFRCVEPSDASCAASWPDRPYLVGTECVECRLDSHCTEPDEPYCHPDSHACGECLTDDQCGGDYPVCSGGFCWECHEDADCPGQLCVEERWCADCDPVRCPAETPFCLDGACVECLYSPQCPENHGCQAGTCVYEAIACSSDECDEHALLDVCSDEGVCAECESSLDCWWIFGEVCHETLDICVDCNDDSNCWGDERCTPEGECVQCLTHADCVDADYPGCHQGYCEGDCASAADCTDPDEPICYTGFCVSCSQDSDCIGHPDGPICSYDLQCGECREDEDCVGNPDGDQCWGNECRPSCEQYFDCQVDMGEYICGSYPDNCGGFFGCGDCGNGGTCLGLDCDCPADDFDQESPNDTAAGASDLGDTPDAPDTEMILHALSIDSDSDTDWYTFYAEDGWDFANPHLTIELESNSWDYDDDSRYELTVWLDCAFGDSNDSECLQGSVSGETTHGVGCVDDGVYATVELKSYCGGTTDESAVGLIRVRKTRRYGRCDNYELRLSVQ